MTPFAVTSLPITRWSRGAAPFAAFRSSPSFWSTICDSSCGRKKKTTTASARAVTAKNNRASLFRSDRSGRSLRFIYLSRKWYPTPRTVNISSGSFASRSIFSRR